MSRISICIPTYEMNGKGVNYLEHSLNILNKQTYKDFEVVISDQSENNDIENLCKKWSNYLNIKHIYYREGEKRSSSNINNAIKNANSEVIKILFQDDFLYDNQSLETELVHFLGNHNHWMISACCHTKDGINLINPFYPKYHDNIHYGNNTISSPSVLMLKKESFLKFDENLFWLMDVEFYKRMFDSFGLPSICNYITVVNREHEDQVSNVFVNDEVRKKELAYISEKYK
jgi:glycosyltransferase involved in cell wall biosynthesis